MPEKPHTRRWRKSTLRRRARPLKPRRRRVVSPGRPVPVLDCTGCKATLREASESLEAWYRGPRQIAISSLLQVARALRDTPVRASNHPLGHRAHEPDLPVVLIAVKLRSRQRRRAHEDGIGSLRAVVITTKGEQPLVVRLRLAAGRRERRPGDTALDGPALILVAGLVERPFQNDDGLAPEQGGVVNPPAN